MSRVLIRTPRRLTRRPYRARRAPQHHDVVAAVVEATPVPRGLIVLVGVMGGLGAARADRRPGGDPVNAEERAAALKLAGKGVQVDDGYSYGVPAADLAAYSSTIRALVGKIDQLTSVSVSGTDVLSVALDMNGWVTVTSAIETFADLVGPDRAVQLRALIANVDHQVKLQLTATAREVHP